jgi:5-methylcytosine-specific restriction protein A
MNRREFIESHGATCKNWQWSWSFINEPERFIIFGAWDRDTKGRTSRIFSEDWERPRGHKSAGYDQSREHIRLIEEEGYRLKTFPMERADIGDDDGRAKRVKIGGFTPKLTERMLTRVGTNWYAADSGVTSPLAEELSLPEKYSEDARLTVIINAYERSAKARAACIAHHGHACAVCGFDFGQVFGALGEGFIHVHHVVPIGKVGKEYKVDPVEDLIPICPNCHAMIHQSEPPLTIEQLRKHISDLKKS